VDDIVVKSKWADQVIANLEQTFAKLRANGIKLNLEKCIFGVPRGMLLGFIFSERGIKAKPEKISAITRMGLIQKIKGVQQVIGCLTVLSRFFPLLGKRGLPLYRLLKKADHFEWTPEAQEVLDKVKQLLTKAPILVPSTDG
jgi:hypothetical protein